jgi:hypothetical protein
LRTTEEEGEEAVVVASAAKKNPLCVAFALDFFSLLYIKKKRE